MEKLIELLNEYSWCDVEIKKREDKSDLYLLDGFAVCEERILWKKYWFIRWLVENDKIERNEFIHKSRDWDIFNEKLSAKEDDYLCLLMLLSIQDEPIRFLISILK